MLYILGASISYSDSFRGPWDVELKGVQNFESYFTHIYQPDKLVLISMVSFYQKAISPIDGNRCPMYPSCSHYMIQSLRKHHTLMATIMTVDRLNRCGHDLGYYKTMKLGHRLYYYDSPDSLSKVRAVYSE